MKPKLYYLFLMSLIGATSTANSASDRYTKPVKKALNSLINKGKNTTPHSIKKSLNSFSKDVKNRVLSWKKPAEPSLREDIAQHPFLWLMASVVNGGLGIFLHLGLYNPLQNSSLFKFLNIVSAANPIQLIVGGGVAFLIYAVLCTFPAGWASRWGDSGTKDTRQMIRAFKIHLWRYVRFMCASYMLVLLNFYVQFFGGKLGGNLYPDEYNNNPALFFAYSAILALLVYGGVVAYDAWKSKKKSVSLRKP